MSSQTEKIENIIKGISKTEIRTLTQIKDLNNEAVDDIFADFIIYPRNEENKLDSLEELKEYQLIHYSDLYKGDKVAYFKTRDFWNIKLITGTVVGQNKKGEYSVKLKGNKTVYVLPKYIFRKLTDEEKFKIQLIEAVFTM
tara:strand:- start:3 stop:425 length:423 start_codon:yes stop_codon:yes gene_type:complete